MDVVTENEAKIIFLENNVKGLKENLIEKQMRVKDAEATLKDAQTDERETQVAIDYMQMSIDVFKGERPSANGTPDDVEVEENEGNPATGKRKYTKRKNKTGNSIFKKDGIVGRAEQVLFKFRVPKKLKLLKEDCKFKHNEAT